MPTLSKIGRQRSCVKMVTSKKKREKRQINKKRKEKKSGEEKQRRKYSGTFRSSRCYNNQSPKTTTPCDCTSCKLSQPIFGWATNGVWPHRQCKFALEVRGSSHPRVRHTQTIWSVSTASLLINWESLNGMQAERISPAMDQQYRAIRQLQLPPHYAGSWGACALPLCRRH